MSEFVDAGERPSPPAALQDYQRLPVSIQIPPASEIVDAAERPSPPVAFAFVQDRQISPASGLVFTNERHSSPTDSGRCSDDGKNFQRHFRFDNRNQSLPMRAPNFAGEGPRPLVTLQDS